ncbi:MAG: hypothetical protein ACSLE3_03185, partial [Microbacteriaceae bacterium]
MVIPRDPLFRRNGSGAHYIDAEYRLIDGIADGRGDEADAIARSRYLDVGGIADATVGDGHPRPDPGTAQQLTAR